MRFIHFGPVIGGVVISPVLCKELLERGRQTTVSHTQQLAGHLDKENLFPDKDKHWFVENFKQYFIPYFRKIQDQHDPLFYYAVHPFKKCMIQNLWINFMKAGEYNPPHTHSGSYSFVLFLQVPEEIKKESADFKGIGPGPGHIRFKYGEEQPEIMTKHSILPVANEMWIFPASLYHSVPPFKSDVERISVSGNILLTEGVGVKNTPTYEGGELSFITDKAEFNI